MSFSEKLEHIPIKKWRFLFRSLSPLSKNSSPQYEETTRPIRSQHASGLGCPSDLTVASMATFGMQPPHMYMAMATL